MHTSLSPIRHGFAPDFVNYKKGCTRLTVASDKVYQLLAHGWWFSLGTPASSTTKSSCDDIAVILLKVALNTKNQSVTWTLTCDRPQNQIFLYVSWLLIKMKIKDTSPSLEQFQNPIEKKCSKRTIVNLRICVFYRFINPVTSSQSGVLVIFC